MRCVVCKQTIDPASVQYANAWESALKQHPCCSQACCAKFDPTVHWLPGEAPTSLSDDEANKRVALGKSRLKNGDSPGTVARDLLIAGVPSWMVRRALFGAAAAAASSDRTTNGWNILGIFSWIFAGAGVFVRDGSRGLADPKEVVGSTDQIDEWEEHFGVPKSPGGAG
jgi:hypothetical protein